MKMLNRLFILLFFLLSVTLCVLFYIFGIPRFVDDFVSQLMMPVADVVVTDNVLRDGGEYWEVVSDGGKQIGFQKTIIRNKYFQQQSRLLLLRRGERFDVAMTSVSESDADGFFVAGKSMMKVGLNPIETNFQVQDDKLMISNGETKNSIAWNKVAGADAVIRSLLEKPMQIGDERKMTYFDPSQSQIIETKLKATEIKVSNQCNGRKLLDIFVRSYVADKVIFEGRYSVDRNGNIIYTEIEFGDRIISTLRTSKRHATAILTANNHVEYGDIGEVQLHTPITLPRELTPISFSVKIKSIKNNSLDIKDTFVDSPFQKVKIIHPQRAVITVWSSINEDPTQYGNKEYEITNNNTTNTADDSKQFDEYLMSSGLINLDDPDLQKLADSIESDKLTVWQTAVELEKLVSQRIRLISFRLGFASSSDVLQSGCGDCTEQAVLLTALCRKKGIPSRVVLGFVYANQKDKKESQDVIMVFHLWNEVYVAGIWRPLDAAFGFGGADAARIKITDDSLKNDSIAAICRSILKTIGQIEIHIEKF